MLVSTLLYIYYCCCILFCDVLKCFILFKRVSSWQVECQRHCNMFRMEEDWIYWSKWGLTVFCWSFCNSSDIWQHAFFCHDSFDPDPRVRQTFWTMILCPTFFTFLVYGATQTTLQRYCGMATINEARN